MILAKKEQQLKAYEAELQSRERMIIQKQEVRQVELNERERLLNEILKMYEMPLVNGDLQKYLDQNTCSTAVGSGTQLSTGLKESKLSFSPPTNVD